MSANRLDGVIRRKAANCTRSASRDVSPSKPALPLPVIKVHFLSQAPAYFGGVTGTPGVACTEQVSGPRGHGSAR